MFVQVRRGCHAKEEQEQASGSGGPGTIMTYQKKQLPKRRKFTQEVRSVPTMEDRSWIKKDGERGYPGTRKRILEEPYWEEVDSIGRDNIQDEVGPEEIAGYANEAEEGEEVNEIEEDYEIEEAVEEEAEDQPDDEVEVEPHEEPQEDEEGEEQDDDEETETGADDYWEITDYVVTRHHHNIRKKLFHPSGGRMDLPVDITRLEDSRVTVKHYEDGGEVVVVRDKWNGGEVDVHVKRSQEEWSASREDRTESICFGGSPRTWMMGAW